MTPEDVTTIIRQATSQPASARLTHVCTGCQRRFTPKCAPCVKKNGARCPFCGAPGKPISR